MQYPHLGRNWVVMSATLVPSAADGTSQSWDVTYPNPGRGHPPKMSSCRLAGPGSNNLIRQPPDIV